MLHANLKKIRAAKKVYPEQGFRMAVPRLWKKVYHSTEYLTISPSNVQNILQYLPAMSTPVQPSHVGQKVASHKIWTKLHNRDNCPSFFKPTICSIHLQLIFEMDTKTDNRNWRTTTAHDEKDIKSKYLKSHKASEMSRKWCSKIISKTTNKEANGRVIAMSLNDHLQKEVI